MDILLYAVKTFTTIFIIMGPFSIIPIFISLTENNTEEEKLKIIRKTITTSFLLCIVFAFFGTSLFKLFGITINSFRIAGGLLLILMAINMLQAKRSKVRVTPDEHRESLDKDDVSIFPLAIPMIAGPGTISTLVLISSETTTFSHWTILILCIALSSLILYLILFLSEKLFKFLGQTGLNIVTRVMGLILASIATEYILQGIKAYFKI
ncbi:MAG: NAAT family transporter [Pseudomonadota bacterium]